MKLTGYIYILLLYTYTEDTILYDELVRGTDTE